MLWDIFWKHIQVGFSFVCTKFPHIDDKSQCDAQSVTDDLLKLKNFFFWNLDKEDGSSFIQLHHFLVVSVSNCCSSDTPTSDSPLKTQGVKNLFSMKNSSQRYVIHILDTMDISRLTLGFLMFSGRIEMEHWREKG